MGRFSITPEEILQANRVIAAHEAMMRGVAARDVFTGFVAVDGPFTKDRDDAIRIDVNSDGSFVMHVAIANVGGWIEIGSPIYLMALDRAFTRYRAGFNITMLPRVLSEGIFSLNAGELRDAIVTSCYFDAQYRFQGARFARRVILCDNMTYEEMSQLIADSHPVYRPWAEIAHRLSLGRNGHALAGYYDEKRHIYVDEDGVARAVEHGMSNAYKFVATCMLATNMGASSFMAQAEIPAIYRNQRAKIRLTKQYCNSLEEARRMLSEKNGNILSYLDVERADYSEMSYGHLTLGVPSYGHYTSTGRRADDMLNQQQQIYTEHWIRSVAQLAAAETNQNATIVEDKLWSQATVLHAASVRRNVRGLESSLQSVGFDGASAVAIAGQVLEDRGLPSMPHHRQSLADYVPLLNKRTDREKGIAHRDYDDEVKIWLKRVFPDTTATGLWGFGRGSFSRLLIGAATEGLINDVFYEHILERMRADTEVVDDAARSAAQSHALKPEDYATLLMVSRHLDHRWWELKEEALKRLSMDFELTNQVLQSIEKQMDWKDFYLREATLLGPDARWYCAAASITLKGRELAAPYFEAVPDRGDERYLHKVLQHRARFGLIAAIARGTLTEAEALDLPQALRGKSMDLVEHLPNLPKVDFHADPYKWLQQEAPKHGWELRWNERKHAVKPLALHEKHCQVVQTKGDNVLVESHACGSNAKLVFREAAMEAVGLLEKNRLLTDSPAFQLEGTTVPVASRAL